jgi:hypothetical protein
MLNKFQTPEIVLGAVFSSLLWAGIWGWADSYAPTKRQKQECYDAAKASGRKTEECKSVWERTTSDPVALYTFGVFIFTGILGISTIFLWRVTRTTANAAQKSAEISEQALIVTQRAFIRVANYPWLWRGDHARPGKYFYDITPIIENFGNTPTVGAKINVNSALRDTILPEYFDFSYQGEAGDTLVGPKQTIGASRAEILDDDLLAVQKMEKFFYIWGVITYRDVFETTPLRTTEFCTEISRVIGDPLDPREPGNPKGTTVEIGFRIYPKHQKTD